MRRRAGGSESEEEVCRNRRAVCTWKCRSQLRTWRLWTALSQLRASLSCRMSLTLLVSLRPVLEGPQAGRDLEHCISDHFHGLASLNPQAATCAGWIITGIKTGIFITPLGAEVQRKTRQADGSDLGPETASPSPVETHALLLKTAPSHAGASRASPRTPGPAPTHPGPPGRRCCPSQAGRAWA